MDLKTPLYDCHVACGGQPVPFAGYLLPVQYEAGILAEHKATRTAAGLFDVSHMGEVMLEGADALNFIQLLVTNDCTNMYNGQVRYSPMCNAEGGVVDDLLVYKMDDNRYMLVVNASNHDKDVAWMRAHLTGEVVMTDISADVAQIALQGPRSLEILSKLTAEQSIPLKYYSFVEHGVVADLPCLVSKTGYTGEDGFELYCAPDKAAAIYKALLTAGAEFGILPCGLGARDTLRLEASMPLYGHEMNDEISPLETGLDPFVKMTKADFIGKEAILARGAITRKRVGLRVTSRGIAREECRVSVDGKDIGWVTSGTHCPHLGYACAMAMLDLPYTELGTKVQIEVRGRLLEAEVIALPFYKKPKK